jgi:alpha-L-rhamnosidase
MGKCLVPLFFAFLFGSASVAAPSLTVTRLRCEYAENPIGIDVLQPRLSWVLESEERGQVQSAYQVLVASTREKLDADQGDLWDTGKMKSDQSIHVAYAGAPLRSRMSCHWKVRVWDGADGPSPYSRPAHWEMGLLNPSDWKAVWITYEPPPEPKPEPADVKPDLTGAKWIWFPEGNPAADCPPGKRFFRKSFETPPDQKLKSAQVLVTADDQFAMYLNGKPATNSSGQSDSWRQPSLIDVKGLLAPGRNLLAVEATNAGGPAGLIAKVMLCPETGRPAVVVSDNTWKAGKDGPAGWNGAGFSDAAWTAAQETASFGGGPWGTPGKPEDTTPSERRRALCFRSSFEIPGKVVRARAYASGLGVYEMTINGRRVGKTVFPPGWTNYGRRIQYQTYDVTALLNDGPNVVAAVAGSGWWNGMGGYGGNRPRFVLQLVIETADGKEKLVVTDDSWQGHTAPILYDSFYNGETYDARLETPGWDKPGFEGKDWGRVTLLNEKVDRLIAQQTQPIEITAELRATNVVRVSEGVHVFDFGQNASGRCALRVRGAKPGTRIQIRHAEVLQASGNIYTENYRGAKATDVYLCKGGAEEEWEPRFTYRGFRYAELTGYPGDPPNDALAMRVLHSAAPPAGQFECSNELVNRIWRCITWGQRSNMHSVPTDCPQRDERLGWTGDAQIFAPTACWNMDMSLFFSKWTRDIIYHGGGGEVMGGGPGWSDATVVIPWTLYCFYADRRIVEESYPRMASFVEDRIKGSKGNLLEQGGYGDWIAVVGSPNEPIGSAYYFYSVKLLSRMAAAIGKADDAEKYAKLLPGIMAAFNAKHLNATNNFYTGKTQTALALPLYFGMVPADRRRAVEGNLVKDIVARGYHPSTGFLGTPYILPVLSAAGEPEVAYRMVSQKTYPSWGYMVEKGATTIWELWNSDTAGPGMNSRNHFALGSIGQWFFESLAGINFDPERPGFKHFVVRPEPAGDLQWARAEYPGMYGPIRSAWKIDNGKFVLEVAVPVNTSATVCVPARNADAVTEGGRPAGQAPGVKFLRMEQDRAVFSVGSGAYTFAAAR